MPYSKGEGIGGFGTKMQGTSAFSNFKLLKLTQPICFFLSLQKPYAYVYIGPYLLCTCIISQNKSLCNRQINKSSQIFFVKNAENEGIAQKTFTSSDLCDILKEWCEKRRPPDLSAGGVFFV